MSSQNEEKTAPEDKAIEKKREPKIGDKATAMDFSSGENFALLQRVAGVLADSDLVPVIYKGKLANCLIALNMAERLRADPLMVMQNLYIVQGKPGWSATFKIATFNQNGGFSKIRYEWKGEPNTPEWGCRAWAIEKLTQERLDGPWITWKLANDEGWVNKSGSKWKTMPLKMFMYRAGSWFVDVYAPELSMGLPASEDLEDGPIIDLTQGTDGYGFQEEPQSNNGEKSSSLADQLRAKREAKTSEAKTAAPETPAETEPVVDSSPSPEEPKDATEEPAGDGGMVAEDDLRGEAQALYDKNSKTQGKVGKTRAALQALGVATVKEIPVEKLSGFIDTLNSI